MIAIAARAMRSRRAAPLEFFEPMVMKLFERPVRRIYKREAG